MNSRPSIGLMVGAPIWLIAVVLLIGFAVVCFLNDEPGFGALTAVVAVIAGVLLVLPTPVGFGDIGSDFHHWQPVSGQIESISSRLISADHGSTQKFVVQFVDDPKPYACNDTRCSLLKVGDNLQLSCKRAWQFTGVSGYDCNYVSKDGR